MRLTIVVRIAAGLVKVAVFSALDSQRGLEATLQVETAAAARELERAQTYYGARQVRGSRRDRRAL
jgi:hypothetical protein